MNSYPRCYSFGFFLYWFVAMIQLVFSFVAKASSFLFSRVESPTNGIIGYKWQWEIIFCSGHRTVVMWEPFAKVPSQLTVTDIFLFHLWISYPIYRCTFVWYLSTYHGISRLAGLFAEKAKLLAIFYVYTYLPTYLGTTTKSRETMPSLATYIQQAPTDANKTPQEWSMAFSPCAVGSPYYHPSTTSLLTKGWSWRGSIPQWIIFRRFYFGRWTDNVFSLHLFSTHMRVLTLQ